MQARENKKTLRATLKQKRLSLSPSEVVSRSTLVQNLLLSQDYWQKAASVALYMDTQKEVSTRLLLEDAWALGKTVYLPRVTEVKQGKMEFAVCQNAKELSPASFGILEPAPALPPAEFGSTACPYPDIFILPGLGFDRSGQRLGFGGGFYDRFLADTALRKHTRVIALAYSFQLLEKIPAEVWDKPVDAICMEDNFLWINPPR